MVCGWIGFAPVLGHTLADSAIVPVSATADYELRLVTFTSPAPPNDPPNSQVRVHYYKPRARGPHPAVIVLHHFGVERLTPERELAVRLARSGIAAAIPELPYHLDRTPTGWRSGRAFVGSDVPRIVRTAEQSVIEVHALASWLRNQPEIDPSRIGIAGLSLGGMLAILAQGRECEFRAVALILSGGNVADTLWSSANQTYARRSWRAQGYTRESLARALAAIEPLNNLRPQSRCPVLMVNALCDQVVPRKNTTLLWEALDRPPITWVTSGHYIVDWVRNDIYSEVTDYFLAGFGMRAAYRAPARIAARRVKLGVTLDHSPFAAVGGSVDIVKPVLLPFTLEAHLSTAGLSVAAGIEAGRNVTFGVQRRLFSSETRLLPFAMVYFVL